MSLRRDGVMLMNHELFPPDPRLFDSAPGGSGVRLTACFLRTLEGVHIVPQKRRSFTPIVDSRLL